MFMQVEIWDTNIFNTIEIAIVLVPLVEVHADEAADVS